MRRIDVMRLFVGAALLSMALVPGGLAHAKAPGPNGQIAFVRQDPTACPQQGCSGTYRVNPDGSHQQVLLPGTGVPHWSPNGTEVTVLADCSFGGQCGAVIVNPDTGTSRVVPNPDPARFDEFFSCIVWSPDGSRLACDAVGDAPGSTGIFTVRSSDGGDLTKVLACETECGPIDYSPDGKRLVIGQPDVTNVEVGALAVVRINGAGLHQITPAGLTVDLLNGMASWSPSGNQILFGAWPDADHRRGLFAVSADGSGLHQLPIPGCGGSFSNRNSVACFDPGWSPDGTKIVFSRASVYLNIQNIYYAGVDGSGLTQVTHEGQGLGVCCSDWGTHPPAS
jgi:Tol biopolymer transport system component